MLWIKCFVQCVVLFFGLFTNLTSGDQQLFYPVVSVNEKFFPMLSVLTYVLKHVPRKQLRKVPNINLGVTLHWISIISKGIININTVKLHSAW